MKIVFKYNLGKEYDNLRCGIGSLNHPGELPEMAQKILKQGIKLDDKDAVLAFFNRQMKKENINIGDKLADLGKEWDPIAMEVEKRLKKLFNTSLELGEVTAYLTVSMMCGYNTKKNYFFISLRRIHPNKTIVHEILHFYTHALYEKQFEDLGLPFEDFNDYKEALTFLLKTNFSDLLQGDLEDGYEKQEKLRTFLKSKWPHCKNINELTNVTLRQFFKYEKQIISGC